MRPVRKTIASALSAAPSHANRLANETSPYLLQHAHNPVHWFAWGDEAFAAARTQDKPIFLSVGYSTCYWCHVMERESFENDSIASIMNSHFICIKVDREERPDVDDIYMAATQMLSGSGGWPMSVFLEPHSLKPFLAGTYFPPEDKLGRPGFASVLRHIANVWQTQRDAVLQQANNVAEAISEHLRHRSAPVQIGEREVQRAIDQLMGVFDPVHGGFGHAPKFPTPVNLEFLIGAGSQKEPVRNALRFTLDHMAMGGMYDQVGGGFHRYSVDEQWLVPHFEKMLYDNAQLACVYARAHELNGDPFHAEIVRETLDYVLREMTSDEGAFFSAQDAEVNTREGENYLWTEAELRQALEQANLQSEIELAIDLYGLRNGPNFHDPHHPEDPPKNVLHLIDRPDRLAERNGLLLTEFNARLERINHALLAVRSKRDQPGADDKTLAGWNGLMIAAMADGARVLGETKYANAAHRAAAFVLQRMRSNGSGGGGLFRTYRNGQARIDGFLEDYAMMLRGLLALHGLDQQPSESSSLRSAIELAHLAKQRFWDAQAGGYFDTLENQSDLFVRIKSTYDGAVPSGNSLMLHNLLDLHTFTGDAQYLDDAQATLQSLSGAMYRQPTACILATLALHRVLSEYPDQLSSSSTQQQAPAPAAPVRIAARPDRIDLKHNTPVHVTIELHIDEPYHINAHEPGVEFLVPLELKLLDGEGVRLAIDYPQGDAFRASPAPSDEPPIFVHTGAVSILITLERISEVQGTPRLMITYQPCTGRECLAPRTEQVGLNIMSSV